MSVMLLAGRVSSGAAASSSVGVVMDAEGAGAHARVQVNFEAAGPKWLVMAFANLQPA